MIRLLHIITSMNPLSGGPSQGIRNLDKAMSDIGVVREVVCLDAPDSNYLGMDEFKIHALGPARGPWCYGPQLAPWLRDNICRFDIVIINGLWLYSSYATWRAIDNIKKHSPEKKTPRVLVMPHGMLDPYFQQDKDRKLKALRNWLYWKLIEKRVVNDADGLLFTCETELLLARSTFSPYHPKKEYNVGYGIAAPPPYKQEMAEAFNELCPGLGRKPYFLFLSRIHPKKGVDILIKAYIILCRTIKPRVGSMPKLVIAGPGIDSRFGKGLMQQLNKAPEIMDNVIFPGMLTGDAKWGAFYGCEAFVLPSHQENFGIAVVEALACGKPVLISNQINIWKEIETEGAGLIAKDNLTSTKRMLEQWLNLNLDEKKIMQQSALFCFEKYYSIIMAAKNLGSVIKEV